MMFLLLTIVVAISKAQDSDPSIDVTYSAGTVRGFHVDYGSNTSQLYYGKGDIFLGIPYVEPPIGNLRFKKPVPITRLSSNPYDATSNKLSCPQPYEELMSEDCLYLNVFTPNVKSAVKYPVMLWIHGGSLLTGGVKEVPYKGAVRNFVSRGVVVVVIQYRLGLLGFFTTFTDDFPANLGMLDQVEAIKWTKNNILAFGGDPNRITLFGQSAGAAAVSAHTYSPLSQNLFHGAIMESGTVMTCFDGALGFSDMRQRRAQEICNISITQWNNNDLSSLKSCLMTTNYTAWLDYETNPDDRLGWKIVQDNYFMPDIPTNLASKRPNIPVMLGSTKDEWAMIEMSNIEAANNSMLSYTKSGFEKSLQTQFSFLTNRDSRVARLFENIYLPPGTADDDHMAYVKLNTDAFSCVLFTGFIGREIENYLLNNNSQIYLYEFTYFSAISALMFPTEIPGWKPVAHSAEIPFVWAIELFWESGVNMITATDYEMLDWFAKTWTDFAKLGMPNTPIPWNPVVDNNLQYYQIDAKDAGMHREYRRKDQVLWNDVLPVLIGTWPPYSINYPYAMFNNKNSEKMQ